MKTKRKRINRSLHQEEHVYTASDAGRQVGYCFDILRFGGITLFFIFYIFLVDPQSVVMCILLLVLLAIIAVIILSLPNKKNF